MEFYYINSNGERLDLSEYPYKFQSGNLLDWNFAYNTESGATKDYTYGFKMSVKEITCKLAIMCDYSIPIEQRRIEWKEAVNRLADIVQVDIYENKSGKLYSDSGYYLSCKIVGSEKSNWKMGLPIMFNDIKILVDYPFWVKEEKKKFYPQTEVKYENGLDFNYDYAYDYTSQKKGTATWYVDNIRDSDFEMIVYGTCVNPRIIINGHAYEVFDTLESNEYLVINSQKNTVIKYLANGTTKNLFDLRGKQQSVFETIPKGNLNLSWSGDFGFDITLFLERSEPKWN